MSGLARDSCLQDFWADSTLASRKRASGSPAGDARDIYQGHTAEILIAIG
jgi:hypothetical protein